jgi:hypothetical protein
VGTQASQVAPQTSPSNAPLTYTFLFNKLCDAVGILNLTSATLLRIKVYNGAVHPDNLVYTAEKEASDNTILIDWYDYFFSDFDPLKDYVFENIPPYVSARFVVEVYGADYTAPDPGVPVKVGSIVPGQVIEIAPSQYGAKGGIVDYSRKETDEFGNVVVVRRRFSKTIDVTCLIDNSRLDYIVKTLSEIRAVPVVWFDESEFEALIAYGFYKDWTFNISYPRHSDVSLQIESLT